MSSWSETTTYHGQPVIKEPVWTWEIPCYFYTGGLAGASAGLAFLCELRGNEMLAKRAWANALFGNSVSPLLLTMDLGKPTRFINMLRMFKVTSPMSVGSWVLTVNGTATGISTLNAWFGVLPRLSRIARPVAALFGLPLSTYTASLVSNTAVPVWHEARRELPFVFAAGAALSAGAAGVVLAPVEQARPARRLALAGAVLELALTQLMKRRLGEHAEAYEHGTPSMFERGAQVGIGLGGTLLARRGGSSRIAAMLGGGLLSAGALSARWSVFKAGFRSASEPKFTVGPQRERIARGERAGAARREARVSAAAGTPGAGSPATVVSADGAGPDTGAVSTAIST